MRTYLTTGDAARVLDVTPAAVRAMADRGDLPVAGETEGGIRLFKRETVVELAEEREEVASDE